MEEEGPWLCVPGQRFEDGVHLSLFIFYVFPPFVFSVPLSPSLRDWRFSTRRKKKNWNCQRRRPLTFHEKKKRGCEGPRRARGAFGTIRSFVRPYSTASLPFCWRNNFSSRRKNVNGIFALSTRTEGEIIWRTSGDFYHVLSCCSALNRFDCWWIVTDKRNRRRIPVGSSDDGSLALLFQNLTTSKRRNMSKIAAVCNTGQVFCFPPISAETHYPRAISVIKKLKIVNVYIRHTGGC